MKKILLVIILSMSLVGCRQKETTDGTDSSLPDTTQSENVTYSAAVADLENVQINQIYRNGTFQEQGMFVIENSQLKVYKKYASPNPNQSPEKLAEEKEKMAAELGLASSDDFEEFIDTTYEGCVIKVAGPKYFVDAEGYSEIFEKVGPNRLKDQKGVEYEVIK